MTFLPHRHTPRQNTDGVSMKPGGMQLLIISYSVKQVSGFDRVESVQMAPRGEPMASLLLRTSDSHLWSSQVEIRGHRTGRSRVWWPLQHINGSKSPES